MAESDSRKELLARALLEYLELHPNEPVSVTSITRICGISRQSFYYHFRDIHDLYAWTLHHELVKTVRPVRGEGWRTEIQAVLERMYENRLLVMRAAQARGSVNIDELLKNELGIHIMRSVEEISTGLGIAPADRALIARFYTAGLVEIVRLWIDDGMREPPERLAERLSLFFVNSSELLENLNRMR
ncbi:MAG: TetR family transcriptional regulator C-terminal domain-containing protein [Atopobiaceae bacterium]|nr:TetR family transcriptional regulator C-terminal domain-containing protein [Atopobiaceae bacterium]